VLNQPIVTVADAGGAAARGALINDAFARTAPGFGGDTPEAALEALYQVATGRGFDGDGTTTGEGGGQPAGLLATQANFCSVPLNAVTFARRPRAPAGFVPVSGTVSRKFKPSRRGQVRVKLKLNKLGRALLARSTALPLETRAEVRERKGTTLSALFQTLLRLR
jgi:hypothetical protein